MITAASCVKDQITHPDLLGSPTERVVRVNEGVLIYDSTALNDSLSWVFPPASRLYRWTITPADPQAVFSGLADHGKAEVIFNGSGKLAPAQGTISVGEFSGRRSAEHFLGKTYSGTMSMNSSGTFSFSWDNSGAVRIK